MNGAIYQQNEIVTLYGIVFFLNLPGHIKILYAF